MIDQGNGVYKYLGESATLRGIEPSLMELFAEIIAARDPTLLESVLDTQDPTIEPRDQLIEILGDEHIRGIVPDGSGSTQRSKDAALLIDQVVAAFPLEDE